VLLALQCSTCGHALCGQAHADRHSCVHVTNHLAWHSCIWQIVLLHLHSAKPQHEICLKTKEASAAAALESDKPCLKPSCRRQHLFGLPAAGRMLGSVRGGRKQQLPSDHCKHSLIVDMVLYKLQTSPIHTPRMCCQVQVAYAIAALPRGAAGHCNANPCAMQTTPALDVGALQKGQD
jgi:hypothetical protein